MVQFVDCAGTPAQGPGSSAPQVVHGSGRAFTVDIHCHAQSFRADALVRLHQPPQAPGAQHIGEATRAVNAALNERIAEPLTVARRRLQDMDAAGIDVQAVSPSPGHYQYGLPAEIGRTMAQMVNDDIAELVAQAPRRFVGLGTVPLQDTTMAIAEMKRCVRGLGMRGIMINTNVDGAELAAPEREAFFAAAEELGVLLFLHPMTFWQGPRFGQHYLSNVVGNPLDSTVALSHLIFEGVLERHAGLKMCVAHGGGYLPLYSGRMDHAFHHRADCCGKIHRPPSSYLEQLYFDTVVFDPEQVASLVQRFGSERILMGTDYPYDMAEPDPVGLLLRVPGLSGEDRVRIAGANAAGLLGIDLDELANERGGKV
jgi:aminocarboxymuconate-semialdehyde decarboxylase